MPSHVWLFVTPWNAAHQASLSFTIFQSLLKLVSIESMTLSNHLRFCHPLFLMPSILPSIRVSWTRLSRLPVHRILQARILECVAILFSRGHSQPRDRTQISCIAGRFFTVWATREALINMALGFGKFFSLLQTSLVAQMVKRLPTMRETWVRSLCREDPLENEMATRFSTLAWKTPWTEETGRLQSVGLQRVRHDWATSLHFTLLILPTLFSEGCRSGQHSSSLQIAKFSSNLPQHGLT